MLLRHLNNSLKTVLALALFMTINLILVNSAFAGTNFGQSPSSNNIIAMSHDPAGNILAIDSKGKVMRYDYLRWTVIHNEITSYSYDFAYYDVTLNRIVMQRTLSGVSQCCSVYDCNTNTYLFIDLVSPVISYNITDGENVKFFYRAGDLYCLKSHNAHSDGDYKGYIQLYKYTGTWNLVSDANGSGALTDILQTLSGLSADYNPNTDVIWMVCGQRLSYTNSSVCQYNFKTNTWTIVGPGAIFYGYDVVSIRCVDDNSIGVSYYRNSYGAFLYPQNTTLVSGANNSVPIFGPDAYRAYWECKDTVLYYGSTNMGDIGFRARGAVYDKYGNIFFGGDGGKVAVRDSGGMFHNNSDFYTDYVINYDIKNGVVQSLAAAQQAKASADLAAQNALNAYGAANSAKNAADTAASNALDSYNKANEAAINTIYNNQSAAYWAYLAANNINVDDTPPVIQKLSGANGATCTTKSSFSVVVNASDNKPGQLQARAKVDSGSFGSWVNIPQSAISVTLSTSGAHTITVEVKDAAGNVSSATMIAFRI